MQAENIAMKQFQDALDTCVNNWSSGNAFVMLPDNLQVVLGDAALCYFKRTLIESVGEPVTFTFSGGDGGAHTFVQMPENQSSQPAQLFSELDITDSSPKTVIPKQTKMSTGIKKAPRPMNCWIIFRDAMHKKIKAENPTLRVQEISTRCSQIWRSLTPAEKEPWKAAAKSAKEEHIRLHPDYKYSPRKPGQKKRRQSRKAKLAASAVAAAIGTETSSMPASLPLATIETRGVALNPYYYNEAARQAQLEAEFGTYFEDLTRNIYSDDVLVFRDDADNSAGLPVLSPRFL